jgi:hypothetical protein
MSSGPHTGRLVRPSDDRTIPDEFGPKIPPNYYCRARNTKLQKYCQARAGAGTNHPGVGRCRHHGGQQEDDGRVTHGRESFLRSTRVKELIEKHLAVDNPLDVSVTLATAKALMDDYIERYYELLPMLEAWYTSRAPLDESQRLALLRCLDELEETYQGEPTEQQRADLADARAAVAHLAEPQPDKPRQLLDISDAVRHADVISKIIHRVNMHQSQNAISYARLATFLFELKRELDSVVTDQDLRRRIDERIMQVRI